MYCMYVPDLMANLLSVNKIVEKDNTVIFNKDNGCTIYNKLDDIVANCVPRDGVYKFQKRPTKILNSE